MMNWKSYFRIIKDELKLLKRKQSVMNSLLEEKRISQYIYGILGKEIEKVSVEIETRQRILDSGIASKIEKLRNKIETLEKSFDQSIREYLETLPVDREPIQFEQEPVKTEKEMIYENKLSEGQRNSLENIKETKNEMLVDESNEDEHTEIDQGEEKESTLIQLSKVSEPEKKDLSEYEFPLPLDATTENLNSTITIIENVILDLKSGNYVSASRLIEELLVSMNSVFEKTSEGDLNHLLLSNIIQLLNKARQDLYDSSSEPSESLHKTITIFESLKDEKEAIKRIQDRHPIPSPTI